MLAKARCLDADAVVLDLEDGVAEAQRNDETRLRVVQALLEADWHATTRTVRVNGTDTEWCASDVTALVVGAGDVLDCVVLPKVEDHSHIHFLDHLLTGLEKANGVRKRIGIEAQIETARGLVNVERIASASTRIEALIFGPGDYAASLGVPQLSVGIDEPDYPGDQWHYPRSRIVTTARAFGLQAIDGPYAAFRDFEGFRESARHARLLGFDGKWAIHPDQVEPYNEAFTPPQEQYEDAERLLEFYEQFGSQQGQGAVMYQGEMIDEASRRMAEAIVLQGRASGLVRSRAG